MGKTEGLRPKEKWRTEVVSVPSAHRKAMFRSIKVCRMENPLHPCHPLFNKSMWSGGYCTQVFFFARRDAEDLEYSVFDAEEGLLPWRGTAQ